MKYAVITGTSRGLGQSIGKFFLESGVHVIGVSRNETNELKQVARENGVTFHDYRCDLSDVSEVESVFQRIIEHVYADGPDTVYVVNNAGMVEPVDQAQNLTPEQLSKHMHVNTIAPIAITNLFLQKGTEMDIPLFGLIVTSGAANKPTYGWSAYCTSKASVNMYVKTAALEQDELQTNHKIIAFSPGIMDTAMQERIRKSSPEAFKDVETFRSHKEKNRLSDVDMIGSVVVDIMHDSESIENGKIYDIRDYV